MNHRGNDRPPQWALAFFHWFCHPEFREDIEGDLMERFNNRITKLGARKAKWLFTKDVLLLFRPGIIRGLKIYTQYKFFNMKRINWIKFAAISLLFIVVIILPFLPGPPNTLVIALSVFGQWAGFFGLLLVPLGITWAILEIRKWRKRNTECPNWRPAYYLAIAATAIITAIYLILVIAAFANAGTLAGFLVLLLIAFGLNRAIRGIKKLRNNSERKLNPMPFYLLVIPLIAFITRMNLMEPLSEYSRSFAIQRSQILINSIEDYKNKEGQYPESIQDLEARYIKKIPSPFIMGIQDFRYNKINDHYSISFSQWLELGSLEEIVLYDKNNLHRVIGTFASYDYSIDLHRVNGAFAIHNTGYDNWRYYLCD